MEMPEKIKGQATEICQSIIEGSSVKKAADKIGISEALYFKWLSLFPELHEDYARARAFRADSRFERIDNVLQDLRDGIIDTNMARVEIDTIKWQAGKEKAKVYGDSTQVKLADADGNKLEIGDILNDINGRTAGLPRDKE